MRNRIEVLGLLHLDATIGCMRTTITFDPDTAALVERIRRERGVGLSTVVNELVRAGAVSRPPARAFVQRTVGMGRSLVDVANVAEALEIGEAPA